MSLSVATTPLENPPIAAASQMRKLCVLFVGAFLFRLIYNAWRGLAPDEAYYWVWSRHLSMSYLDHPPMVAYLIWASTKLFGSTGFGVRFPAALMSAGTAAMGCSLVYRATRSQPMLWLAAVLLVTSPMITLTGTLITPDTPLLFFVTAGLLTAVKLFETGPNESGKRFWLWVLFGILSGLAMLSKYTGVLLPGAVVFAMLTTADARRELLRPGIYVAGLIALGIFSPVLVWNARHEWVSFRFQFTHGFGQDEVPGVMGFLTFFGSLIVTFTPVLTGIAGIAAFGLWRGYRRQPMTMRLILCAATLPLLLFAYSSFRKKVEGNWPAIAFLPTVALAAWWIAQQLPDRRKLMEIAIRVSVVTAVIVHAPELALLVRLRIPVANGVFGWRQFAAEVDAFSKGDPVFASNYQNASELSFYMKGQPEVWSINFNRRSNAFDYFDGKPDMNTLDSAVFVGGDSQFMNKYFKVESSKEILNTYLGMQLRRRTVTRAIKPTTLPSP